jgi:hypothetical protein
MSLLQTPILFIIFNRPDTTRTVFEAIRKAKPAKLYVAADGARANKAGEAQLCEETRAIINSVDWPCEVKKLYRDTNLGCGKGVSGAISWLFEQEETGIILEDDVLPDPSFFNYCSELLHIYSDNQSIMHINGCNFQQGVQRGNGSYYFSAFPHVWGWATWRRAWKMYDFNLSDMNYFYNLNKLRYYFKDKKAIDSWHAIFFKMNRKFIDTWDYQWNYAIWNNKGRVITPNVNMIKNIGFGENATHTLDANSRFSGLDTLSIGPLVYPSTTAIDEDADLHTQNYCY